MLRANANMPASLWSRGLRRSATFPPRGTQRADGGRATRQQAAPRLEALARHGDPSLCSRTKVTARLPSMAAVSVVICGTQYQPRRLRKYSNEGSSPPPLPSRCRRAATRAQPCNSSAAICLAADSPRATHTRARTYTTTTTTHSICPSVPFVLSALRGGLTVHHATRRANATYGRVHRRILTGWTIHSPARGAVLQNTSWTPTRGVARNKASRGDRVRRNDEHAPLRGERCQPRQRIPSSQPLRRPSHHRARTRQRTHATPHWGD